MGKTRPYMGSLNVKTRAMIGRYDAYREKMICLATSYFIFREAARALHLFPRTELQ
jgi:hypothetical protein